MRNTKDVLIRVIEARATRRVGRLAADLVRARSEDKELVLAEMDFERWLAESCLDCHEAG